MLVADAQAGKINKKALNCLFKVIIDDTNYEISGILIIQNIYLLKLSD